MPAKQRGSVYKTRTSGYGIRWRDENGDPKRRAGFKSKTAARDWLETVELPRMRGEAVAPREMTLDAFCVKFLAAKAGKEKATQRTLEVRLRYARKTFGSLPLRELETMAPELAEWRATLPKQSAHGIYSALSQALEQAVRWRHLTTNPAKANENPAPKRREVVPFTHAELDALAIELGHWAPVAVVAAETGLRPAELAGLEWRDVTDTVLVVERTYASGELKPYGKTKRALRRVPLTTRARAALAQVPRRLDTPAVFASPRSARLDFHNFRIREWLPALDAAGIPRRRVYDLRHTFATNALAAGVSLFELSRFMGTSVELLDSTYGHLAEGSEARARELLEAFDSDRLCHERVTAEGAAEIKAT